jgi:hypothetical protein
LGVRNTVGMIKFAYENGLLIWFHFKDILKFLKISLEHPDTNPLK